MGKTEYSVKIPSTMFMEEARGKEGQLGYGLWQLDSTIRFTGISGFIEVEHGSPIGGGLHVDKIIDKARSTVLNSVVTWKINRTETGYYQANANRSKLSLQASASTREGLDSMIAIISTLSSH
ncbi:MAG: hypothetical protein GXC73_14625 [Chitinophagaceae bacterium]|nr:hypothetical protein [Chitinophagaceae bacterium]